MSEAMVNEGISFNTVFKGLREGLKSKELVYNLVGYSGIGKTALVRQVVDELGGDMVEINVSLLQAGDLAMPVKHELEDGSPIVKYVVNEIITKTNRDAKENPERMYVIFLDEVNRADAEVQANLMNLVLQREIFDVKLEDNVRLVTAQNPDRTTEGYEHTNYDVHEVDEATASRVVDIRMRFNARDWLEYGKMTKKENNNQLNVHPMVSGFISNGNEDELLVFDMDKRNTPSPRSWSRVGELLYSLGIEDFKGIDSDLYSFVMESIVGTVGNTSATNFASFAETFTDYIKVDEWLEANEEEFELLLDRYKGYDNTKQVFMVEQLVEYMLENRERSSNQHIMSRTAHVLNLAPSDTITNQLQVISKKLRELFEGEVNTVTMKGIDGKEVQEKRALGMIRYFELVGHSKELEEKINTLTGNSMLKSDHEL